MGSKNLPDQSKAPKPKKEQPSKQMKSTSAPKPKRAQATNPATDDPQSMFKVGFLSDVYQERSIESGAINKVVTR
ncbi:MAG: hypothetical protein L6R35_007092, partial [Caloplaca aegaea]